MPIRLSEIKNKTRSTSFEYDGERVTLAYRPAALTAEMEETAYSAGPGHYMAATAEIVCQLVASWDVMGDDGEPTPVTLDIARQLPMQFLEAILTAVMGDARPPKA